MAGEATDRQIDEIDSHLSTCDPCSTTVDALEREGDSFLDVLKTWNAIRTFSHEQALKTALERAREASPSHVDLATELPDAATDTADMERSPPELDDYELLERVAYGGMGQVYRACHRRLNRIVAVKLLADHRLSKSAADRFGREMKAIGSLDHPNIVRALDAREENDSPFLVMEYIEGIDAASLVRQVGPLAVADAGEIVRQAAVGLQHAHEHGLIHRDLKPSNLMLDSAGCLKIVDFGLAKLIEDADEQAALTKSRHILGTLDYMAPEQWDASGNVDGRADIYSLGCTLYFLLTGAPPFSGADFDSHLKKMKAHAEVVPPTLHKSREDVPQSLAELVSRTLSKRPQDRHDTAEQLGNALRTFAEGSDLPALVTRAAIEPQETGHGRQAHPQRKQVWSWRKLLISVVLLLTVAMLSSLVVHWNCLASDGIGISWC